MLFLNLLVLRFLPDRFSCFDPRLFPLSANEYDAADAVRPTFCAFFESNFPSRFRGFSLIDSRKANLKIAITLIFVAVSCLVRAQTYQLGPEASPNHGSQTVQNQNLGWGSNIENARLARAAEQALQRGDHAQGLEFARRAVAAAPNDPQLWFLFAYAARLNGRYAESADGYKHGLQLKPGAVDGMSGLAQVFSLTGQTNEAVRILKQVVAANPNRRDDMHLLGELLVKSKDYEDAVEWLGRAEHAQPEARTELLLSIAYERLDRKDLADRYLDQAKLHDPNNPEVQRSLAGYYRETGKYSEAIAALQSIRNPKPDVLAELAYTDQLAGKLSESSELYARAADALPNDLELQLSAAQAEVAAGASNQAHAFLRRVEHIDPGSYRLHAIRGEIARAEEHDQEAIGEYRTALAALPKEAPQGPLYGIQLRMDLVQLYQKLRNTGAANSQLQLARSAIGAIDASGATEPYLRLRALIEMTSGDFDGAFADINSALALNSANPDDLQMKGDILMKMERTNDALAAYKEILAVRPRDRFALISLGYASRAAGRNKDAEKYFQKLEGIDPSSYTPYLALGDLYTTMKEFPRAQTAYATGYSLAPQQALIVAGGINAGVEAHNLDAAAQWITRVTPDMLTMPQVLREEERYWSFKGDFKQSAQFGEKGIALLPDDRDVVVYLGYDLLRLERYGDLLALTAKYNDILPKEPDIPLLAGYVHKHNGQLEQAKLDFSEVLRRDPSVVTAYINRGYVLNDLHEPVAAAADFASALQREPGNGEAHLGLAYADLDSKKLDAALRQADLAENAQGDTEEIHVIRATAYGRQGRLAKACDEYRAAIRFAPDDAALHFNLANALSTDRHYRDAIGELKIAAKLSPRDPEIDASLARCYASLHDRELTLRYVDQAENLAQASAQDAKDAEERNLSSIELSTGEAFSTLGDWDAAMERFRRALDAKRSDRVGVRLAIAQLMVNLDRPEDAQRQVALALMEADAGETPPPSGSQYIAAADILRGTHEYQISQDYLSRAKLAGAPDEQVRIGMASNYLAMGDTARAKGELDAVNAESDGDPDYNYLLARADLLLQEHKNAQAVTAFAQASDEAGGDQTAEEALMQAGANEGMRLTPEVSYLANLSTSAIFEDSTVYVLDSKLDASFAVPKSDIDLLPPPRSSLETQNTDVFHLHFGPLPTMAGFFQLRDARGQISVPSLNSIVDRNTVDSTFNLGLSPTMRLGNNVLTLYSGIQETIRRDTESPVEMNQNLFRIFTYGSTSSLFNEVAVSGYVMRETGPFTESNLRSNTFSAAVDMRVGAPWGKTALVTGWGSTDQRFLPESYENYYTSSYVGIDRRFGERLDVEAQAEDLRSWRIVGSRSGIAQDLRPAGSLVFSPQRNWSVQASAAWSSTRSFHVYDMIQSGALVSYTGPFGHRRSVADREARVKYPIRISAGFLGESFFNFPGSQSEQFRPYVSINLF